MAIMLPVARPVSELSLDAEGRALIKHFEGLMLKAYRCSAGKLTIGYGSTRDVTEGVVITLQEAEDRLIQDVKASEALVRSKVAVPLTQAQFNALVSLVFNLGRVPPSLLACINGGVTDKGVEMRPGSWREAADQFLRNCRAKVMQRQLAIPIPVSQPLLGLYRRRMAEAVMFMGFKDWNLATAGVSMKADLGTTTRGEWVYAIDPVETTSLDACLERAARAASVAGLVDEHEANEQAGLAWPQPDPVRVSPEAARESVQPQPPISSPPVSSPQASAPAVEGEGAVAVAPSPNPPKVSVPVSTPAGPVPGAGKISGEPAAKPRPTLETIAKDADIDLVSLRKAIAAFLLWFGNLLRAVGSNGMKVFGFGGSTLTVAADQLGFPFVQTMIVTVGVVVILGVVWLVGFIAEKFGLRSKKKVLSEGAAA